MNLPLAYIEINKKNLISNILVLKNLAKKNTKIIAVIKGNAYGHGQNEIAKILEPYIDYFAVNSILELENLRKISKKEIFILGYVQNCDIKKAINLNCVISVFSLEHLKDIGKIAKQNKKIQKLNIVIDAFLGREGIMIEELPIFLKELQKYKYVKTIGIYAHFANIEDTEDFSYAQKQINEFEKAIKLTQEFDFDNLQTHISATSGLLIYEKNKGINPLVRIGIGLYGLWPSAYLKNKKENFKFNLKPVLSYKTKIAQIKILSKNSTIGYGLTFRTTKETKVAVIPQGYADGIPRALSNTGEVLIDGTKCKILGRVMMNMFVVNVNHLKNIKVEDEVVIIGKQGEQEITADNIGEWAGTINYEITTRLSPLLPKIIV